MDTIRKKAGEALARNNRNDLKESLANHIANQIQLDLEVVDKLVKPEVHYVIDMQEVEFGSETSQILFWFVAKVACCPACYSEQRMFRPHHAKSNRPREISIQEHEGGHLFRG